MSEDVEEQDGLLAAAETSQGVSPPYNISLPHYEIVAKVACGLWDYILAVLDLRRSVQASLVAAHGFSSCGEWA